MAISKVEKGNCRVQVVTGSDGKSRLKLDIFHETIPMLAGKTIELELLSGTTAKQAKDLAESINERMIGVIVTQES